MADQLEFAPPEIKEFVYSQDDTRQDFENKEASREEHDQKKLNNKEVFMTPDPKCKGPPLEHLDEPELKQVVLMGNTSFTNLSTRCDSAVAAFDPTTDTMVQQT